MNKRIEDIDILKGIAILLMILDHCFGWGQGIFLHSVIQSFHMPLFFIVGGYLWKTKGNCIEFIRHKIRTILVPHFNFAVIYSFVFVCLLALHKMNAGGAKSILALFVFPTRLDLTMFASPLWFLQAFFLTEIAFTIIKEKYEENYGWIILIITMLGIIYSKMFSFMLPFAIEPFSTGILFFYIGFKLKNVKIIKIEEKKCWLMIPLIVIWLVLVYLNGCVDMRSARYYNPILYICNGVLGTIIFWNISSLISRYFYLLNVMFRHFSTYSITYLCTHYIFVFYGKGFLHDNLDLPDTVMKIILFICVILICWILNRIIMKYIPWIVGKASLKLYC